MSEGSEVLGKRKRKSPGQWWFSCPPSGSTESGREKQLKVHTSSLAKAGVKVLKKSPATDNVKKKKTQWNKGKNARGATANKMKAATTTTTEEEEVQTKSAEQVDDPLLSSPCLPSRHNLRSGRSWCWHSKLFPL